VATILMIFPKMVTVVYDNAVSLDKEKYLPRVSSFLAVIKKGYMSQTRVH